LRRLKLFYDTILYNPPSTHVRTLLLSYEVRSANFEAEQARKLSAALDNEREAQELVRVHQ
jgi:hypothetical protein